MKLRVFGWVGVGLVCILSARAQATGELSSVPEVPPLEWRGIGGGTLRLSLSERLRGEFVDWFGDPRIGGSAQSRESRYDFVGHKLQLGVGWRSEVVELFLQGQNTVLAGLPRNGVGVGSVYVANTPDRTQATVFVRQGWLRLQHEGFSVALGRQLYRDAGQGLARDPSLRWIQETRWSQRLIGPFDYTHTGRSFDGALLGLRSPTWELSAFAFLPTFGGFETDAMRNLPEIRVAGVSANLLDTSAALPNTVGRVFWSLYQDERALVVTDNRPLDRRRQSVGQMLEIHTLGGNAAHVLALPQGKLDLSAFFYGQVGDWQELDQRAYAYGVEAGYKWEAAWASPWLRAGINVGSGDSDPNDGTHGTFFQMLPTAWQYAMFPFFNMMNNRDVFVQTVLAPTPWWVLRFDWHWLKVDQAEDVLYSGGGATSDSFFGYAGVPTGGETQLAHLVQAYSTVRLHPNAALNLLYAHAFGQAVLAQQFSSRDGNYGFVEVQLTF